VAKKVKKRVARQPWTRSLIAELRRYSKQKLPVAKIAKLMKRSVSAIRGQGSKLGIPLGHRR
jgi:hypothetical protein